MSETPDSGHSQLRGIDSGVLSFSIGRININIRKAQPSDTEVIAEFNVRLADETEQLRLDPALVRTGVAALLNDAAKGFYFVAEAEGQIAGQVMVTFEWSDWRNGNIWWLQSVYVRQEFRRQGVFRALFAYVESQARSRPEVCGIRLYMHADNSRARRSYEQLGMQQTKYQVFELDFSGRGHG